MTTEAMRASRSILAAERSGQLRHYPAGAQIPADIQQLRDEAQQSRASRNGPINPLDHGRTK